MQGADERATANLAANAAAKNALLISGRFNRNGNDGAISRFGWKAQNQSLLIFSGEAYNVEMGITNEVFQVERDQNAACQFATTPNDVTTFDEAVPAEAVGGAEKFAFFMRFAAPPTPSTTLPGGSASIARGRALFDNVGCDNCHTPTLRTAPGSVDALSDKPVNLFSDLALHNMGPGLADDVLQGAARGDEFRTAPLWGLGQRVFFLHDGRTKDLRQAIAAHRSTANSQFAASEANRTIDRYNVLVTAAKQDLLNFLRSL